MRLTAAGVSEVAEAHDTRAAGRGLGRAKPAAAAGPANVQAKVQVRVKRVRVKLAGGVRARNGVLQVAAKNVVEEHQVQPECRDISSRNARPDGTRPLPV